MKRFTIKRLMIIIGVVAVLLALYRALMPQLAPVVPICLGVMLAETGVAWLILRRRPRLAAWSYGVVACLTNAGTALLSAYLTSIAGLVLMYLIEVVALPLQIIAGSIGALGMSRGWRFRRFAALGLVLALVVLPFVTMVTSWPLRLAFALSEPAMNRLADRVAAGRTVATPEWAGLYRVVATVREPTNGNIALIIDANSAGRSGFVRVLDPTQSLFPLYNFNFDEPVGTYWRYQNED